MRWLGFFFHLFYLVTKTEYFLVDHKSISTLQGEIVIIALYLVLSDCVFQFNGVTDANHDVLDHVSLRLLFLSVNSCVNSIRGTTIFFVEVKCKLLVLHFVVHTTCLTLVLINSFFDIESYRPDSIWCIFEQNFLYIAVNFLSSSVLLLAVIEVLVWVCLNSRG